MINAYRTSRRKTAAALKGHQARAIEMVNRKDGVHLQREPTVAQSDRAREARLAAPSYRSLDEELGAEVRAELAEMEHRVLHTTSGLYSVQLTGGAKGVLLEKANGLSDEGHKIKGVIEHYLISTADKSAIHRADSARGSRFGRLAGRQTISDLCANTDRQDLSSCLSLTGLLDQVDRSTKRSIRDGRTELGGFVGRTTRALDFDTLLRSTDFSTDEGLGSNPAQPTCPRGPDARLPACISSWQSISPRVKIPSPLLLPVMKKRTEATCKSGPLPQSASTNR